MRCATARDQLTTYRGKNLCEWDGVDCDALLTDAERADKDTRLVCITNPTGTAGQASG